MKDSAKYRELRDRLSGGVSFLQDKPEETVDSTLHALWHKASGASLSARRAVATPLHPLTSEQSRLLDTLLERRISGVPLPHITGRQHFMELEMICGPDALVPRRETELLACAAIDASHSLPPKANLRALDVCTGSGNVAFAIKQHAPGANVFASDLSEPAIALARENALHLGLAVEFRIGDLLDPFDTPEFHGTVDLLTCNPPYISSAKVEQLPEEIGSHEPHLAFDGGPFGIAIMMRLLKDAPRFVRSGGTLAFEIGLGQGPGIIKRLNSDPSYTDVRGIEDPNGDIRVIAARIA